MARMQVKHPLCFPYLQLFQGTHALGWIQSNHYEIVSPEQMSHIAVDLAPFLSAR
jgi:hypothetical protein